MRAFGIFISCLVSFALSAQPKSFRLQLFYKSNESVNPYNLQRVDSFCKSLNGTLGKIKITGYADFKSAPAYNSRLSRKRAEAVLQQIQANNQAKQFEIVSVTGMGESQSKDNGSPEGDAFSRRVDVDFQALEITDVSDNAVKENASKKSSKNPRTVESVEKLAKGESISIEGLNFEPGRHFITKSSVPVLQKLLKILEENPKLKIEIQGHVCCTMEEDGLDYDTHEKKLSVNRARAVYQYLTSNGIAAERLVYKGYGHSRPKFPQELTAEEEQANRRVEILILEK